MWETGAVYGVALSEGAEETPRVRPLIYRMTASDLPSPLQAAKGSPRNNPARSRSAHLGVVALERPSYWPAGPNVQALRGDSPDDMKQFLGDLVNDFDVLNRTQVMRVGERLESVVGTYVQEVERALDMSPVVPGEAALQKSPALAQTLALTINALQAFYPAAKINGRYFYATSESGRDLLVRAEDVHHETVPMPDEFGFPRIDVEKDADTMVICRSFKFRAPMYEVLGADLATRYPPDLRYHIDPTQGWVLACPVLVKDAKPLGIVCLYGKKPPARNDGDVARFKQVAVRLSEVFARTLQGDGAY